MKNEAAKPPRFLLKAYDLGGFFFCSSFGYFCFWRSFGFFGRFLFFGSSGSGSVFCFKFG